MGDSKQLLKDLEELFKNDGVTTIFRKAGEDDIPCDILSALFTGFGEECPEITVNFMFPGDVSNVDTEVFSIMATVLEDIKPQNAEEMDLILTTVNAYLPIGSFCLFGDDLYFKASSLLPKAFDYDRKSEICEMSVTMMLNACMKYADELCKLAGGKIPAAEFQVQ